MFSIDRHAYSNRLRTVHPGEKFAFASLLLITSLAFPSIVSSLAIFLLMSGTVILRAGIPSRFYLKLMSLPFSFLVVGVITIAVSLSRNPGPALHGITVWGVTIGVTNHDLRVAAQLFLRSLAAVSCLYFLSLTTPMVEIIPVLKKLRVPVLFIELMSLVYRFIFVLMESAERIYTAQSSRCGYATFKSSYFSLGQLASNLFIKSYHQSKLLFTAMESRCYSGEIKVLEPRYNLSPANILIIVLIDLALIALALYTGGNFVGRIYS